MFLDHSSTCVSPTALHSAMLITILELHFASCRPSQDIPELSLLFPTTSRYHSIGFAFSWLTTMQLKQTSSVTARTMVTHSSIMYDNWVRAEIITIKPRS